MSNRGTILLAVGMLVLGLLLGAAGGGVAGFFMGRNGARASIGGQFVPPGMQGGPNNLPGGRNNPPGGLPSTQNVPNGARVVNVEASSAAAKAGLQVGDVITAVAATKIDQDHQIADLIKARKPGDKVDLTVTRGNQTLTLTVELAASPQDSSTAYLGIQYAPLFQGGRRFQ